MEHNAPHKNTAFEGYYNKLQLPSGAHLVLVICKILQKKAISKPNALSLVYVPKDGKNIYHKEIFSNDMEMRRLDDSGSDAFILDIPGYGHAKWLADSTTEYAFENDLFSFHATTTSRTPWSDTANTPEGPLVHLPLPLHWHVHSLASASTFSLHLTDHPLPPEDRSGVATVHQEKNWAFSFPSAHMWVQAQHGDTFLCLAGGQILGLDAFLLGYRSRDLNFDFRPPFAVRFAGMSPFLSYTTDWESRSFELTVQSFRRKIVLKAAAPKGTFFPLSPPFPDGHRENFLNQSFCAKIEVSIYESGWLSAWKLVRTDSFADGSLEFGADYYPPAGTTAKFN